MIDGGLAETVEAETRRQAIVVPRGGTTGTCARGDALTTPLRPGFSRDLTSLFDR